MTNIIKAPIRKIKIAGPDGAHHIVFEEVEEALKRRVLFADDEDNQWALCWGFIELDVRPYLSHDDSKLEYKRQICVMFMNLVDGEYKLFSLRKLMPELECW